MKIRLGYVAISLNLENASTSKTITLATLNSLVDEEKRLFRMRKIVNENLSNLLRILHYNSAEDIEVYRITSKLIPFATHPILYNWDYIEEFKNKLKEIGDYIKKNNFRISAHPDHFSVINTNSNQVYENTLLDLKYHDSIFNAMGLDSSYKLVMHIGGMYNDKIASIERFYEGFSKLSREIKDRIILENDDKIYTADDVLNICKKLKLPMVLDVHHHKCNPGCSNLESILNDIFDTWQGEKFPPKIHLSSPKNDKDFRSHADNINIDEFIKFLKIAKKINKDFDVMLEAKNKDIALQKVMKDLYFPKGLKFLDKSSFEI